jgi:hypothetical protein
MYSVYLRLESQKRHETQSPDNCGSVLYMYNVHFVNTGALAPNWRFTVHLAQNTTTTSLC